MKTSMPAAHAAWPVMGQDNPARVLATNAATDMTSLGSTGWGARDLPPAGLGLPEMIVFGLAMAAIGALVATSFRRAALERRDRRLFERFEERLAVWADGHAGRATPEIIEDARRILDEEIARHVQQDHTLDGQGRLRFANTLRNLMRQRLEDVLERGMR